MRCTVIIVTLDRPDCVDRCLGCLEQQSRQPDEVIVVDASTGDATRSVVAAHCGARYLRNENGFGRMTASRNIGLLHSSGDVIAFVDDDAFAEPEWLGNLLAAYSDSAIGAVGGRALNKRPGEDRHGVERIGQLSRSGELHGFFAADPGRTIDVDHIMGCNMSFRRSVLAELGGFREDYPGISGVREDSDMCLRVRRAGHRIVFTPAAVVEHIGAPQARGRRFDHRYEYYAARNHAVLLVRNYGLLSSVLWRYTLKVAVSCPALALRRIASATVHAGAVAAGTMIGLVSGMALALRTGRDPARRDSAAEEIRRHLSRVSEDTEVAQAAATRPPR